ncbi:MAG TPA: helix-turn-helix domain-containing protein [Verrucomicrobiae bacterium]|nr:helix-turn-helix domain-containing protein [Verrucomicrobiae bacterium]
MPVERHLIFQELTLLPSAEWIPRCQGWLMARVAEGAGYWLQHGADTRQLTAGDGLLIFRNGNGVVRASQLGSLKLQFFTVQPQYLNGLLTVTEWHQLEVAPKNPSPPATLFTAGEPLGQKFTRLAEQSHAERLPMRCALLQFWASAVAGWLTSSAPASIGGNKLRDHFRELVSQMTEAELSECSLSDLSKQLHCSERHFSRLFREEFGVPFRARQIELRLQRARQLLAGSQAKIINIAYDCGYRHLGLFNAMFKKRFGLTPSEWRQQNLRKYPPHPARNHLSRTAGRICIWLATLGLAFSLPAFAQTNPPSGDTVAMAKARAALFQKMAELDAQERQAAHPRPVSTNAGPQFDVEKYLLMGNSILPPTAIGEIFTNIPGAFGTNVTFDGIRAALTDLQMAYRERGYVTVAVGLPQQKLTNATVKVQVTEGRLDSINVAGDEWHHYFSSNNVMRALPSLHTNMLLNSHVFQRELDIANANRDRQIYPVIGPGPEPGTSELTLKVKDRLPLHSRVELNNEYTPNTPDLRVAFNAEYDNLWDLEHQIGLQYGFSPTVIEGKHDFWLSPFDDPQIANYSGYYRLPLGHVTSVQEQIEASPGRFGYNEVTHQFNLPTSTGRPELTIYASRSVSDTGIQRGPVGAAIPPAAFTNNGVVYTPISFTTNSAGENITLNEDLGLKLSLPLPPMGKMSATFSLGVDYKHYRQTSYNTNENNFLLEYVDQLGHLNIIPSSVPQPLAATHTTLNYVPLNIGLSGSMPDQWGTTFFNAQMNFNVMPYFSDNADFATAIGTTNGAHAHYVTVQAGADRVQTIYHDWSVKLHADGQWANTRLFSNEQYAMGGSAGVRGYLDGEAYGDTGWRVSIEPQTPLMNIGMVDDNTPLWFRGSVFMDYGQIHLLDGAYFTGVASLNGPTVGTLPGNPSRLSFWGTGFNLTANIGNHLDARFTVAFPLMDPAGRPGFSPGRNAHVYFGVGAQF